MARGGEEEEGMQEKPEENESKMRKWAAKIKKTLLPPPYMEK